MLKTLKYLFDRIFGIRVRRNIFWAPIFGATYYFIFAAMADFVSTMAAPALLRFEPSEEVRHYIGVSLSLTVFYLVFGLCLIFSRRLHYRFSAWVLWGISVMMGFFRVTHVLAAVALTIMSMLRGTNPFDPEIRERATEGEDIPTRASRPPPDVRSSQRTYKRHRSHNIAVEEPLPPKPDGSPDKPA